MATKEISVKTDRTTDRPVDKPIESNANSLMTLINRMALEPAFDVAKLEQLLAVKEKWEAAEAQKAFVSALTAFKADPPEVFKDKTVAFKDVKYNHASLANVSSAIGASLSKHGLSHKWEVEQSNGVIKVTCVLMHFAGHSERISMQAPADQSGSKNSIQAIGSAVTYLERYTLLAATGVAVQDQDDDGRAAGQPIAAPTEAKPATPAAKPVEQKLDEPAVFLVGSVTKKADLFCVTSKTAMVKHFTKDEAVARAAKKAMEDGAMIRVLLEKHGAELWISSMDFDFKGK